MEKQFKFEDGNIYKEQTLTTAEVYEELQRLVVQLNKAHSHIEMLKQSRLETIEFLTTMHSLMQDPDVTWMAMKKKILNKIWELERTKK